VQGVGAAIVNVASLALVGAAFTDPAAKAKAIGSWTGIAAIGLAIGPTVGGFLTESLGWRSIFLVNPIIAVAAVIITVLFVGESRDPADRGFDIPGQLLFIAGIGLITYALIEGPHSGWLSAGILGTLLGGLALLVLFVVVELKSRSPMMDVRVFADRIYSVAIFTIFATLFCIYGTMLVVTQYFQNVRAYSPEDAGLLMLAMTIPTVVFAPMSGRLVARYGGRLPTLIGVGSITAGMAVLAATTGGPVGFTLLGLALAGVAGGLAVSPATSVAMSSIDPDRSGMASGILSAQRALGSTAGFAIMGSVLAAVVAASLPNAFAPYLPNTAERTQLVNDVVADADPRAVVSLIGPGKPLPASVTQSDELLAAADQTFVSGMRIAWVVAFVVILSALIAGWIVFPHGKRRTEDDELAEAGKLDLEEDGAVGA
jgi:MFS family permease